MSSVHSGLRRSARPSRCALQERAHRRAARTRRRRGARARRARPRTAAAAARGSTGATGMPKPFFGRRRISSGTRAAQRALQDQLGARSATASSATGAARANSTTRGVEERRAHLERRRHRGAVGLHQDVVGQVARQVEAQRLVDRTRRGACAAASSSTSRNATSSRGAARGGRAEQRPRSPPAGQRADPRLVPERGRRVHARAGTA